MSKKKRIHALLSDGKQHTKEELIPITHRFGAVIHSLRDHDGYEIETIKIAHNVYVYQLKVA